MQRILNIIGWIGTALVVAAVGLRLFGPPQWTQYAMYMAWSGLVCVLLYPIGQWREISAQFNRRQARYASLAVTSVLVVLGILIAVNYLSNKNINKRWDLTANQAHSLSEQSQKVLSSLDAPLKITLVDRSSEFGRYTDRLTQYANASSQVTIGYLDGERDPIKAKQLGIEAVPTLVLEYKGKTEKVLSVEEREITSAVIRAVSGEQRKAYFVQGHGERSPEGEGGYQTVATLLKGDNVTVAALALSQQKDVPDDATAVVIAGPTSDFLEDEVAQISRYLDRGGKLLLMVDPTIGERAQPLTRLIALANAWGVDIGNDVVLDLQSQRPEFVVAAPPYGQQPITESFKVQTVFPVTRSVTPLTQSPAGKTVQPFVKTGARAWAETDIAGLEKGAAPEMTAAAGDKAGPVSIAVAVTTPAPPAEPKEGDAKAPPQTRFVVIGDSDFASDMYAGLVGNLDLLLNTVNWLVAQENLISIRPKAPNDSRLTMTPGETRVVFWLSVAGVPAAVLAVGLFTWSRRRRG